VKIIRLILDMKHVIGFTADTASVNYGKNYSFHQTLYLLQPSMIKANCHCHIDHDAERQLLKLMSCHVESFVLKACNAFSHSSKMWLILRNALNLSRKSITRFCVTFLIVGLLSSKLLIVYCSVGSPKI